MSFSGSVINILGENTGLYGGKDIQNAPPGSLLRAENVEFSGRTIRKEAGTVRYNSNTLGATTIIMAGHDWTPSGSNKSQIIVTASGSVLSDSGNATFGVTVAAGLTVTGVPQLVEAGHEAVGNAGKLFLFSAGDAPRFMTGDATSMPTLSSPAADWSTVPPAGGAVHENRLWAWAGDRVYYSAATTHESFATQTSGQISVYPGDGGTLVGGISFKGFLVLFKEPRGIYAIDTSSTDTANWRVKRLTESVGSINPKTVTQVTDDVLFLDRTGSINLLSGTSEFGDIKSAALSDLNSITEYIRDNFNRGALEKAVVEYYEDRREVHIAVPKTGDTANTRRLVVDFSAFPNVKFRTANRETISALWRYEGTDGIEKLAYGSNDGFVRIIDQASFSHDDSGYAGTFETLPNDFGPELANVGKNGKFIDVTAELLGDYPFSIDLKWDDAIKETVTINPGEGVAVIGSFIIGTNAIGGESLRTIRKKISGSGRKFSVIVRQDANTHGFAISNIDLLYTRGGIGRG